MSDDTQRKVKYFKQFKAYEVNNAWNLPPLRHTYSCVVLKHRDNFTSHFYLLSQMCYVFFLCEVKTFLRLSAASDLYDGQD